MELHEIKKHIILITLFNFRTDEQRSFVVAYTAKYVYPLCMMAKTCSLYIMVLITIERWIAVCRPLEVLLNF